MYDEISFSPQLSNAAFFELKNVTIGINFHWERKEPQRFKGTLKLIIEEKKLTAINIIPYRRLPDKCYFIRNERNRLFRITKSARCNLQKLVTQQNRERERENEKPQIKTDSAVHSSFIKWYDHEAHTHFDVCADDHCQRYQGITRASTSKAIEAVFSTRGEVLMFENHICDARFSKCCGGALEEFQNCWENVEHPYLVGKRDDKTANELPDLTIEAEADQWIRTSPSAFCNTQDKKILSQVLNNYDQETTDFYRWKVTYTQQELSELIYDRSGIDFGKIIDLIPIERGTSDVS